MRYPIENASSLPGSGNALYFHLIDNIHIPAKLSHTLWYNGCKSLVDDPSNPFMGFFPVGRTLELSYSGSPMQEYTFTGEEKNPVFVKDLSLKTMLELGISKTAKESAKVFNPFFVKYENLPKQTKKDNELPALSLAKSISSFLSSKDVLFTELDVVSMLTTAIQNANSDQMRHILHGNHMAWCASRFIQYGTMEEDIRTNFYSQNDIDFFIKDILTIMPSILYLLAILGVSPLKVITYLDYDLYGISEVAAAIEKLMYSNEKINTKK